MDYTKSVPEVLLAHVKSKNPSLLLTAAQVTFSAVTGTGANVSVVMAAMAGSGYTGSKTLTYGRLNIASVFGLSAPSIELGDHTLISQAIAVLNTTHGLNLVAGVDYTDAAVPVFDGTPNESQVFTLTILEASPLFHGTVEVTLTTGEIPLADAVSEPDLGPLPDVE